MYSGSSSAIPSSASSAAAPPSGSTRSRADRRVSAPAGGGSITDALVRRMPTMSASVARLRRASSTSGVISLDLGLPERVLEGASASSLASDFEPSVNITTLVGNEPASPSRRRRPVAGVLDDLARPVGDALDPDLPLAGGGPVEDRDLDLVLLGGPVGLRRRRLGAAGVVRRSGRSRWWRRRRRSPPRACPPKRICGVDRAAAVELLHPSGALTREPVHAGSGPCGSSGLSMAGIVASPARSETASASAAARSGSRPAQSRRRRRWRACWKVRKASTARPPKATKPRIAPISFSRSTLRAAS